MFGLEPGWSKKDENDEKNGGGTTKLELESYSTALQMKWPFNRNAFKLLAAMNGREISDYKSFAEEQHIFERGSQEYLKGNLHPLAFRQVEDWDRTASSSTGFLDKESYRLWIKENRFPVITEWIERCRPKLFIGVGNSHRKEFMTVTRSPSYEERKFPINGFTKKMYLTKSGLVPLAVIPHLSRGKNGLNSDEAIQKTADKIRDYFWNIFNHS